MQDITCFQHLKRENLLFFLPNVCNQGRLVAKPDTISVILFAFIFRKKRTNEKILTQKYGCESVGRNTKENQNSQNQFGMYCTVTQVE